MAGYKECLSCKRETEPADLFTLYMDGVYVDICRDCLADITKGRIREIIQSSDAFIRHRMNRSRQLQCPVCKSSKIETEFLVVAIVDESINEGLDGIVICRDCFRQKFEKTYSEKEITEVIGKHDTAIADVSTTRQMTSLGEYHKILEEVAPSHPKDDFNCSICDDVYASSEMPYVQIIQVKKNKTITSGCVCIECYRKLWKAAAQRNAPEGKLYDLVTDAILKLSGY